MGAVCGWWHYPPRWCFSWKQWVFWLTFIVVIFGLGHNTTRHSSEQKLFLIPGFFKPPPTEPFTPALPGASGWQRKAQRQQKSRRGPAVGWFETQPGRKSSHPVIFTMFYFSVSFNNVRSCKNKMGLCVFKSI